MKKLHNITYFGADCRRQYCPPKVLRILPVTPEGELMAGSVVDNTIVRTMGQESEDFKIVDPWPTSPEGNMFDSPGWDNSPWS